MENQEEIHHFVGWEGGGLRGYNNFVNKNYVNKWAFPILPGFRVVFGVVYPNTKERKIRGILGLTGAGS